MFRVSLSRVRAACAVTALAVTPAAGQSWTLDDLRFMSGCWEGTFGNGGVMEEFYSTPSANLMVGTTRYLRGARVVQFEFTRVERDSTGTIWMIPYPSGRMSEDPFRLTTWDGREAVFEAPEHDYPKRILYRRLEDGRRVARIDGGPDDTGGQEWILQPADCPRARP